MKFNFKFQLTFLGSCNFGCLQVVSEIRLQRGFYRAKGFLDSEDLSTVKVLYAPVAYATDRSVGGPGAFYRLFGFVVFTTRRFVLSCFALCSVFFFSVLFSIVVTSLGEERAGLYAYRAFNSLCSTSVSVLFFSSS